MNAERFAAMARKIERRLADEPRRQREAIKRMARQAGAVQVIASGKVVGFRLRDGSMVCRKRRYRDEVAARIDMARIAATSGAKRVPVRAYHCPHCAGWHTTSQRERK